MEEIKKTNEQGKFETMGEVIDDAIESVENVNDSVGEIMSEGEKKVEEYAEKFEEILENRKTWKNLKQTDWVEKIIIKFINGMLWLANKILVLFKKGRGVHLATTDYIQKLKEKEHMFLVRVQSFKTVLAEYEQKFKEFEDYIKKQDIKIMENEIKNK